MREYLPEAIAAVSVCADQLWRQAGLSRAGARIVGAARGELDPRGDGSDGCCTLCIFFRRVIARTRETRCLTASR
jgi:hypothetical protein